MFFCYEGLWPPPNRKIISGEPGLRAGPPLSKGFFAKGFFLLRYKVHTTYGKNPYGRAHPWKQDRPDSINPINPVCFCCQSSHGKKSGGDSGSWPDDEYQISGALLGQPVGQGYAAIRDRGSRVIACDRV